MKTVKFLLCMLLITIGLFGANAGANPAKEPAVNSDVGTVASVKNSQSSNDFTMIKYLPISQYLYVEKVNVKKQVFAENQTPVCQFIILERINLKKQDLAENQTPVYSIYPKVNDLSKFWQHNKYGGGINLNDYLAKLT